MNAVEELMREVAKYDALVKMYKSEDPIDHDKVIHTLQIYVQRKEELKQLLAELKSNRLIGE